MVSNGKSQSKMDDLKVQPFLETPVCQNWRLLSVVWVVFFWTSPYFAKIRLFHGKFTIIVIHSYTMLYHIHSYPICRWKSSKSHSGCPNWVPTEFPNKGALVDSGEVAHHLGHRTEVAVAFNAALVDPLSEKTWSINLWWTVPFCHGKIHHFSWENPLFLWPFSIANC